MKKLSLLLLVSLLSMGCSSFKEHFFQNPDKTLKNKTTAYSDGKNIDSINFKGLNAVEIESTLYQLQPAYHSASGDICRLGTNLTSNKTINRLLICSPNGDAPWFVVPSVIASYHLKG